MKRKHSTQTTLISYSLDIDRSKKLTLKGRDKIIVSNKSNNSFYKFYADNYFKNRLNETFQDPLRGQERMNDIDSKKMASCIYRLINLNI